MLTDLFLSLPAFQELVNAVREGQSFANLQLPRAVRLPVLAALQVALRRPLLLITDRTSRALTLMEEIGIYAAQARRLLFSEPTALFYEPAPWGEMTRLNRLTTLTTLAKQQIPALKEERQTEAPPIILAPVRAVMTKTMPRRDFILNTRILRRGQQAQIDTLIQQWIELCYEPVNIVTAPGQFARRGGILDIWTIADAHPTRLDFFGDEVDSLRLFDPATQRTLANSQRLVVTPSREYIASPEAKTAGWLGEEQPLSEFHIPQLYPNAASVLNYLPPESLVFVDDELTLGDTLDDVEKQALGLRQDALESGIISQDFPLPYHTREEVEALLTRSQHVVLGPVMSDVLEEGVPALRQYFSAGTRFGGRVKTVFEHVLRQLEYGDQVIIVSRQMTRLQDLWQDFPGGRGAGQKTAFAPENPHFIQSSLSEGWVLAPLEDLHLPGVHLLTDGEIFGWQPPQARRRARPTAEEPESAYADLRMDDPVVHVDHGIGVFKGLVRRTIEGIENEYLLIEYAQGDQLFVPVYQADRITRYVGADSRSPSLNRLGSSEWQTIKERVRENVEEVARELLQLYATRQVVTGYAFSADTPWQHELEASFPYVETPDQLQVLTQVKRDMESTRPMDRLICGDVGYGKTEIALRAAFKAVMDGKQVAILVPTTVLAQQHFNTFRERLAPFPVQVEMLSRFRTPQEQQVIINRLKEGKVDIIIGTHRLFSSDVKLKDLGLLIIDEEQRFGVTHKEALKRMRSEVDVLTLTATPIPRTLYMALTDIRDISTINTPPAERLPVITHVGPYSPRLVRQAIVRELERGGQVFFVHNRVQTIEGIRQHLNKLVPEARVAIAHGQMSETELSRRMREFTSPASDEERIDILLSTSIIESGLDIPNANTLIVDRADTFGLAQLYQLRGRIGRGAQRAYAYFFRHKKIVPTVEGRLRLETLAEYTNLGAGLSIAMRDLEIRGAGELLGTQQHGHISAVGFHLYTRLLAEAVRKLHGERGVAPPEERGIGKKWQPISALQPAIDLPLAISIPPDYIEDKHVRLNLYRRLADMREMAEIDNLNEEFHDRFGAPPEAVQNLLYQLKIKLLAEQAGLASVGVEHKLISMRYPALPKDFTQRRFPFFERDVRVGKNGLWLEYTHQEDWKTRLVEVLYVLINAKTAETATTPDLQEA